MEIGERSYEFFINPIFLQKFIETDLHIKVYHFLLQETAKLGTNNTVLKSTQCIKATQKISYEHFNLSTI